MIQVVISQNQGDSATPRQVSAMRVLKPTSHLASRSWRTLRETQAPTMVPAPRPL
jgi:hypothetical protein